MRNPRLAITSGDPNGIGPEIIAKALAAYRGTTEITIFGDDMLFHAAGLTLPGNVRLSPVDPTFAVSCGKGSASSGRYAMKSLEAAVAAAKAGQQDGIVTAPISKETVNMAGWHIPGHTEWLAEQFNSHVLMILAGEKLRVAMVTGHVPLRAVPGLITRERVIDMVLRFDAALRADFGCAAPRIAVLGLNPHAGDGGILGMEEIEIIQPALQLLQKQGILCEGPFAGDGFFGNQQYLRVDGVLAMYHDQGLTAFKALQFGSGVNVTAGLPVIRTSPDHGTAFDIAGRNLADSSSFLHALLLAETMARNRT